MSVNNYTCDCCVSLKKKYKIHFTFNILGLKSLLRRTDDKLSVPIFMSIQMSSIIRKLVFKFLKFRKK